MISSLDGSRRNEIQMRHACKRGLLLQFSQVSAQARDDMNPLANSRLLVILGDAVKEVMTYLSLQQFNIHNS